VDGISYPIGKEQDKMTDLTPFDALDIVKSCLEHFADDPLVAEAAAVLAAALNEREQLREACAGLLKYVQWIRDNHGVLTASQAELTARAALKTGKE